MSTLWVRIPVTTSQPTVWRLLCLLVMCVVCGFVGLFDGCWLAQHKGVLWADGIVFQLLMFADSLAEWLWR